MCMAVSTSYDKTTDKPEVTTTEVNAAAAQAPAVVEPPVVIDPVPEGVQEMLWIFTSVLIQII